MNPEVLATPAFSLKRMQKMFYIALAFNAIAAIVALALFFLTDARETASSYWKGWNPAYFVFIYMGLSTINTASTRKMYKYITEITDTTARFEAYEKFFRKRMIMNTVFFIVTCIMLIVTGTYVFLFLIGMQLLMHIFFFPRPKTLSNIFPEGQIAFS